VSTRTVISLGILGAVMCFGMYQMDTPVGTGVLALVYTLAVLAANANSRGEGGHDDDHNSTGTV